MSDEHNPPVSPIIIGEKLFDEGMSLRDYFAGQALAGLMANPDLADDAGPRYAYFFADEMLAVRKTPSTNPADRGEG